MRKECGTEAVARFDQLPLGIDFHQRGAVCVKQVHPRSHAEVKGLQSGWLLLRVNGEDVSGMSLKQVSELIKETARLLNDPSCVRKTI